MKAVILISSIFFILGLKVSHKIDLGIKNNAVDTLISTKIIPQHPVGTNHIQQLPKTLKPDSLQVTEDMEKQEDPS